MSERNSRSEQSSRKRRGKKKFQLTTWQKIIFCLFAALFLAGLSLLLWVISGSTREGDVASCLASAYTSLEELKPEAVRKVVVPGYEWKEVGDEATDQLFTLAHPRNCDGRNPKPPLLDRWGNRIRVSVREQASGSLEFKLTSYGADGKQDTNDDIVYPRS